MEQQFRECFASISISEKFKDWAIKHLHDLHAQEKSMQDDMVKSQRKALQECLGAIDTLVNLKTSSGNRNGMLLSDDEYAERRGKLLTEKATLEQLLQNAEQRLEQPLKLSAETFEIAHAAMKKFAEGDANTKKEILAAVQSNLTLKDKKLIFEARKPFLILENTLYPETRVIKPIEPEKNDVAQGRKTPTIFMRPYLLGGLDDVRAYGYKAERAAALIYAHFKKEFGCRVKSD
jgi:hypothetical protein